MRHFTGSFRDIITTSTFLKRLCVVTVRVCDSAVLRYADTL